MEKRTIYYFKCRRCGKEKRQTFNRTKAQIEYCRKCLHIFLTKEIPGQTMIFGNDRFIESWDTPKLK